LETLFDVEKYLFFWAYEENIRPSEGGFSVFLSQFFEVIDINRWAGGFLVEKNSTGWSRY
jgi:hypothetical protein